MTLAGGLLLALIVSVVVVMPLRTAAKQFLHIFRGQESADSRPFPMSDNPTDFYRRVFSKTRTKGIRQTEVANPEKASQLAGFHVLMPSRWPDGMEPVTEISVIGAHAYRVEVDLAAARALLQTLDLPTDTLSAGKDHVQVTAAIEPSVMMHQAQGSQWFTLIEGRNPVVAIPEGFDSGQLHQLGELGLQSLGLSRAEARQLSQRMTWASILVLPPDDMDSAQSVSINGHSGYVLRNAEPGNDYAAVLWEAEGVLCGVYGGLSAAELLTIAESLE